MKNKYMQKLKNSRIVRVLFARKSVVICLIILSIMVLAAILAPLAAPYDPYKQDLRNMLKGMSMDHIF